MQPSPIQLTDLRFIGVKIWARSIGEEDSATEGEFDFDGVIIGESIEVAPIGEETNPTAFAVKLRIVIENKEGKFAPYDVDIEAAGLFEVHGEVIADKREDLVVVNGCAMIYGAIRELVLNVTSRGANGSLVLPTVNFLDHKKTMEKTTD